MNVENTPSDNNSKMERPLNPKKRVLEHFKANPPAETNKSERSSPSSSASDHRSDASTNGDQVVQNGRNVGEKGIEVIELFMDDVVELPVSSMTLNSDSAIKSDKGPKSYKSSTEQQPAPLTSTPSNKAKPPASTPWPSSDHIYSLVDRGLCKFKGMFKRGPDLTTPKGPEPCTGNQEPPATLILDTRPTHHDPNDSSGFGSGMDASFNDSVGSGPPGPSTSRSKATPTYYGGKREELPTRALDFNDEAAHITPAQTQPKPKYERQKKDPKVKADGQVEEPKAKKPRKAPGSLDPGNKPTPKRQGSKYLEKAEFYEMLIPVQMDLQVLARKGDIKNGNGGTPAPDMVEVVPGVPEVVPMAPEVILQGREVIPAPPKVTPAQSEVIPRAIILVAPPKVLPTLPAVIPRATVIVAPPEVIPKALEVVQKATEVIQEAPEVIPSLPEPIPRAPEYVPKVPEPVPEGPGVVPNPAESDDDEDRLVMDIDDGPSPAPRMDPESGSDPNQLIIDPRIRKPKAVYKAYPFPWAGSFTNVVDPQKDTFLTINWVGTDILRQASIHCAHARGGWDHVNATEDLPEEFLWGNAHLVFNSYPIDGLGVKGFKVWAYFQNNGHYVESIAFQGCVFNSLETILKLLDKAPKVKAMYFKDCPTLFKALREGPERFRKCFLKRLESLTRLEIYDEVGELTNSNRKDFMVRVLASCKSVQSLLIKGGNETLNVISYDFLREHSKRLTELYLDFTRLHRPRAPRLPIFLVTISWTYSKLKSLIIDNIVPPTEAELSAMARFFKGAKRLSSLEFRKDFPFSKGSGVVEAIPKGLKKLKLVQLESSKEDGLAELLSRSVKLSSLTIVATPDQRLVPVLEDYFATARKSMLNFTLSDACPLTPWSFLDLLKTGAPALATLDLSRFSGIVPETGDVLSPIFGCGGLKVLILSGLQLGDEHLLRGLMEEPELKPVGDLIGLNEVSAKYHSIIGRHTTILGLKNLRVLALDGTRIGNKTVGFLAQFLRLTKLDISDTKATTEGLQFLASKTKDNLMSLRILGCNIPNNIGTICPVVDRIWQLNFKKRIERGPSFYQPTEREQFELKLK